MNNMEALPNHSKPAKPRWFLYVAILVLVSSVTWSVGHRMGSSQNTPLPQAPVDLVVPNLFGDDLNAWCKARVAAGTQGLSTRAKNWLTDCVAVSNTPSSSPSPSPSPTPTTPSPTPTTPSPTPTTPSPTPTTPSPSPSPSPSGCPVAGKNLPGAADPWGGCFPGPGNTGIPAGTVITSYTGPCTISTAGTVIDAKAITCDQLVINAANVTITRSRITSTGPQGLSAVGANSTGLVIADSEVVSQINSSGVDGDNYVLTRLDIHGGNRGAWCSNCTIQDSWIHGGRVTGSTHASALRADQFSTYTHNSMICDGGGTNCSADLTGYPDFNTTTHWTIGRNLFGSPAGSFFCAYGGASAGKPFSNDPANATYIQFTNNVFARGPQGTCAAPSGGGGSPIADYDTSKPGWVFSGNVWDTGEPLTL